MTETTTDERAEHMSHPRTAADQLRAIFAGAEHADDGRIAALARELLAELECGGAWRWDESVVWNAPDTITVPISRDGVDGELAMDAAQAAILAEMLADAALADPAPERDFSPGYRGEIPDHQGPADACAMPACVTARARREAVADIQDLTYELLAGHEPKAGA